MWWLKIEHFLVVIKLFRRKHAKMLENNAMVKIKEYSVVINLCQ